jgi:hypothetical protein
VNWQGVLVPSKRELVIELALMMVIGAALAALGPFGSFGLGSFAERLIYWLPISLIGYAIFRPVMAYARDQGERLELPVGAAPAAGVLIAAAPLTLIVLWWNPDGLGVWPLFEDWFELFLQVALIGALVTLTFAAIERRLHRPTDFEIPDRASSPAEAQDSRPPFLARLPPEWAGELTALEMEDHYVRAHGPEVSRLILMRLRDAERELSGIDGLRVHRSWWVSRGAVEEVIRDGRNFKLRLKGGLEAPVARDRIPALRSAGWLD